MFPCVENKASSLQIRYDKDIMYNITHGLRQEGRNYDLKQSRVGPFFGVNLRIRSVFLTIPIIQIIPTDTSKPQPLQNLSRNASAHIMHYQTLLVALFAATAFAKDPWVSSFYNADCTGPGAGDAVNVDGDECVPFDSKYDAVAVNFGTNLDEIDALNVFSDANCMNYAGTAITSPMADQTPQQCVSQSRHGGKWGSVQKVIK